MSLSDAQVKVSIVKEVGQRREESAEAPVLLYNISATELQFATKLCFPISTDYAIRVNMVADAWQFSVLSYVRWRRNCGNLYVYGCKFFLDTELRQAIKNAIKIKWRENNPQSWRLRVKYEQAVESNAASGLNIDRRT